MTEAINKFGSVSLLKSELFREGGRQGLWQVNGKSAREYDALSRLKGDWQMKLSPNRNSRKWQNELRRFWSYHNRSSGVASAFCQFLKIRWKDFRLFSLELITRTVAVSQNRNKFCFLAAVTSFSFIRSRSNAASKMICKSQERSVFYWRLRHSHRALLPLSLIVSSLAIHSAPFSRLNDVTELRVTVAYCQARLMREIFESDGDYLLIKARETVQEQRNALPTTKPFSICMSWPWCNFMYLLRSTSSESYRQLDILMNALAH